MLNKLFTEEHPRHCETLIDRLANRFARTPT